MNIRQETPIDYKEVNNLHREAFYNVYKPGCDEHYLMHILRDSDSFIKELSFVYEKDNKIVGHIAFSKAIITDENNNQIEVACIGPIGVLPDYQNRGIGTALIKHGKNSAKEMGYIAILLYGDPLYYSKCGFQQAYKYRITTKDGNFSNALQVLILNPPKTSKIKGRFSENNLFTVDEKKSAEFDKNYPPKEKLENTKEQKRFSQIIKADKYYNNFLIRNPTYKNNLVIFEQFGTPYTKLADDLAQLILSGKKTATCSRYTKYTNHVKKGQLTVVLSSEDEPLCIIKTVKTEYKKMNEVTKDFAKAEGEGDRTLKYWYDVHKNFFSSELIQENKEFSDDILLICEQFKVIHVF
ncbi:MAG: GNAT family N-acetyltransferase [Defluviitaleaceae bacterium]|nr:GNAT family N-acetyltransferase [Defluviitaleaceae bacterium]